MVCPGEDKVRQAPDFTNLLEPAPTIRPGWPAKAFCIVPNIRMIEGARQGNAGAYLNFLLTGAKAAREAGLTPVVVLHVANGDEAFLEPLQAEFGGGLAVFQEDDPLQLKGLLRQAYMILGSRFHALANGLSQQVPCIACGWSHKYRALFEDYACAENVQPVTADEAVINRLILKLADPTAHAVAVEQLGHQSEQLKVQTRAMWTEVDRCLGVVRPDDPSVSGSEA